jgi:hypothetical protein
VQQWIKVFYRQPDHLPRVRATTDWTCAVRTQRDRCEAMCKHYQHQNLADTDHLAHPSVGALSCFLEFEILVLRLNILSRVEFYGEAESELKSTF